MTSPEDLRELGELAMSLGRRCRRRTEELLRPLTETARRLFGAAACSLALLIEDESELVDTTAAGEGADDVTGMRIPASEGIAAWAVQSGQPIAVSELRTIRASPWRRLSRPGTSRRPSSRSRSRRRSGCSGSSACSTAMRRPGAEQDMALLSLFADQAALALASVDSVQRPRAGAAGCAGRRSGRR